MMRRSIAATAALAAGAVVLLASGCTDAQRAEQKGQDVGAALCDVRDAEGQEQVDQAMADFEQELDELAADHASFTAEDRDDIRENLSDLVEHVVEGDEALIRQDLAVIRNNLDDIGGDVSDTTRAAASGFVQGLDDCI